MKREEMYIVLLRLASTMHDKATEAIDRGEWRKVRAFIEAAEEVVLALDMEIDPPADDAIERIAHVGEIAREFMAKVNPELVERLQAERAAQTEQTEAQWIPEAWKSAVADPEMTEEERERYRVEV